MISFVCPLQLNGEKREASAAQRKLRGKEQLGGVIWKWTSRGKRPEVIAEANV